MKYIVKILCLLIIVLQFSCEKFLTIDPPINQLLTENVFEDAASAEATVIGLYSRMMYPNNGSRPINGTITLFAGLSSDELSETVASGIYSNFETNDLHPDHQYNYSVWLSTYNEIYQTNSIIDQLASSTKLPADLRRALTAEVRFFRALYHFHLVNLYGKVPLVLTSDYRVSGSARRSEIKDIYAAIIDDLKVAQTDLPETGRYLRKIYTSRNAATALLARAYLYIEKWEDAITEASALIDGKKYPLETIDKVFKPASTESILQLVPANTVSYSTTEGNWFIPAQNNARPTYHLTTHLLQAFEAGDLRKQHWTNFVDFEGTVYHYPYKYQVAQENSSANSENLIVLRASELYLIRAEAYAQTNQLDLAVDDIDELRGRAGLPLIADIHPNITQPNLLNAIYKERQTELFVEFGHRWMDLKRTGRADAVLAPVKPNWKSTAALWPIPLSDILQNPFLDPNPGYN